MSPLPLLLTEYVTTRGVPLSVADAQTLRESVRSMTVQRSWDASDSFDLTPGSEVGVVALHDRSVVIRPKVPVDRVLFLVSYAMDPARWQDQHSRFGHADSLVEGMAMMLAQETERAVRRGLLQGYRSRDEPTVSVRGRVRFDEQLRRRFGRPLPVEVTYDEYSEDTTLNRVLLAAVWRLSRLPIRSARVRSMIGHCYNILADRVSLIEFPPAALPSVGWDRLNRHYRVAVELSLMVLRSTSIEVAAGQRTARGFVIDMNVVFEEFIRAALRQALGLTEPAFPAGSRSAVVLDQAQQVRLEPDLSWWVAGRCLFVGDAKYKRVNARGIKHPDLYQLLAYTTALDLPSGLLIYAAGEAERAEHTVVYSGKRLRVATVNLSGDATDILADVERIAQSITEDLRRQP